MANDFRFLMYNSPEEDVSINAVVKDETIWLSQKAMAELFDCSPDNISLHLKNIYSDGELSEKATAEDFSVVQQEGKRNVIPEHKTTQKTKVGITLIFGHNSNFSCDIKRRT